MAPDDPSGVRELRFRFGSYHIIVTADPHGGGCVRVIDDFYNAPPAETNRNALASALRLLSVARKWVFDAYLKAGGSLDELRRLMDED